MKSLMYHERSKYIDIKMHFLRDTITNGKVKVTKVAREDNCADMLTHVLSRDKLEHCLVTI